MSAVQFVNPKQIGNTIGRTEFLKVKLLDTPYWC